MLVFFYATIVHGAPVVKNIDVRGLQIGGTTLITIEGEQLSANPRMYGPIQIRHQKPTVESANKVSLAVTLDAQIDADIYPFRIITDVGVSNAFLLGVDKLPQTGLKESIEQFPIAMHGNLTGGMIHKFKIKTKKGEQFVVDIEGNRLGSSIRPILRLYNEHGTQVAWAKPARVIGGDARFKTKFDGAGTYLLEVHDQVFKGPGPGFFRLKIGQLSYADFAFPMAVAAAVKTAVRFSSSNLDDSTWISNFGAGSDFVKVSLPKTAQRFTGSRPVVGINRHHQELVEDQANNNQLISAPIAVSACLEKKGESDSYRFKVRPGTNYRFEVTSHRYGTALDSVLTILDSAGKQLGRSDDHSKSLDPGLDFTPREGTEEVTVNISSLAGDFGPDCLYRLHVYESGLKEFQLTASIDSITTGSGNRVVIPLQISRSGYSGKIEVSLDNSNSDAFYSSPMILEASDEIGLFSFTSRHFTQAVVPLRIRATAIEHPASPSQLVNIPAIRGLQKNSPWHQEIVTSIQLGSSPDVNWSESLPSQVIQGTQQAAKINFGSATTNPVRLSLLSSQPMPKKKEGNNQVDDVARALRLEGQTVEPGATEAPVSVVIPRDLPDKSWLVLVKAEYLSEDKKRVVSTEYTDIVRLQSVTSLSTKLDSESKPKISIGQNAFAEFQGSLSRLSGFEFPVKVFLTGLPKEYGVPSVSVPKDQSSFSLAVSLRREKDAKKLQNLRLEAAFDAPVVDKYSGIRSKTIPLEIELTK